MTFRTDLQDLTQDAIDALEAARLAQIAQEAADLAATRAARFAGIDDLIALKTGEAAALGRYGADLFDFTQIELTTDLATALGDYSYRIFPYGSLTFTFGSDIPAILTKLDTDLSLTPRTTIYSRGVYNPFSQTTLILYHVTLSAHWDPP